MAKYPENPEEIFEEFTADYTRAFGQDLVGISLYGSAAGGEYVPGRSDLNFLIVLTLNGIENLEKAFKIVERWQKRKVSVPVFVTVDYVTTSLDVFPIEYLDMQRRHVKVYGTDILEGLVFDPEHIRLQCEREIKGKLLLLREGFLETGGRARDLKELVSRSLPAFTALFGAVLHLKGAEVPHAKSEVVRKGCASLGLDGSVFEELVSVRRGDSRLKGEQLLSLFKKYLREVEAFSSLVDSLGG